MKRTWLWTLGSLSSVVILFSCGGSDSPTTPSNPPGAATATPAASATATAAPTSTAAPTPAIPAKDDNPGPAVTVHARVQWAATNWLNRGGEIICSSDGSPRPCYDPAVDRDVVPLGAAVMLDATPRNAAGQKCCREADVTWSFENRTLFNHVVGSNKFQYRLEATRRGVAQARVTAAGIPGQPILNIEVR